MFAAIIRDLVERHLFSLVQLARLECPLLGIVVFDRVKIDPVKLHIGCIPVERIADQFDDVILLPSLEHERTSTNVVTGARPLGVALVHPTKLQNCIRIDWEPGGVQKGRKKIRRRPD